VIREHNVHVDIGRWLTQTTHWNTSITNRYRL
jgi:hypothetical protein